MFLHLDAGEGYTGGKIWVCYLTSVVGLTVQDPSKLDGLPVALEQR